MNIASDSIASTNNNVRFDVSASDDVLLAAIAAGNRAAVGVLWARHADALRNAASKALPVHDETSADDIVHEVFLALLEGRSDAFDPARGKPLAWLKGIARREATLHTPPMTAPRVREPRVRMRGRRRRGQS